MTKLCALFLGIVLAYPVWVHAEDNPKIDVLTQKIFREHGVDVKILRSYSQLEETSSRKDGRFLFSCEGMPGIEILLDRDYWVFVAAPQNEKDILSYGLNPKDEQSALNIAVGNDVRDRSDADLSKEPGNAGISAFTFSDGVVGGEKVTWHRWSDQRHLYSHCALFLPAKEGDQAKCKVDIRVTANTEERRSALEDRMATLKLRYSK